MTEPRGSIYLIANSPLNSSYEHTIDFKSPSEQESYWGSLVKYRLNDYSYVRRDKRYIKCSKTFEELDGINYLMYRSREDSKWYYCFVVDREYINDECTAIYFDIDVLQTFMFDYSFKPTYISQGHVDRWTPDHKPIYSKTDEGVDYGSESVNESAYELRADTTIKHGFYLVYCTPHPDMVVAGGEASEVTNIAINPIPYQIYIVPNIEVSAFNGLSTVINSPKVNITIGSDSFISANLEELLKFMGNSAFGNYVKQITYIPYLPIPYHITGDLLPTFTFDSSIVKGGLVTLQGYKLDSNGDKVSVGSSIQLFTINHLTALMMFEDDIGAPQYITTNTPRKGITASLPIFEGLEEHMPTAEQWEALKKAPRTTDFDRRYESKLLCFPYRYNLLTDWRTTPVVIKNEYLGGEEIRVRQVFGWGFNNPQRWYVEDYRKDPQGRRAQVVQPVPMEQPIISDSYYTYLLQNKNQISANMTNSAISAISSTVQGAVSGATSGGVAGAITGGLTSGINNALSYQAMVRSENAKQRDLQSLPDTISNPNDCTFNLTDGSQVLTLYRQSICCEFAEQLAQYWHMYGYIVKKVEVPNLRSRVRFNYIRTVGANITGKMEAPYLESLKAIFDRGVTFWHYSATDFNPLDYTYANPEVSIL